MSVLSMAAVLALTFGLPLVAIWGLSRWFTKGMEVAMQPATDSRR